MQGFGSVTAIREASEGELVSKGGLDSRTAKTVWQHFHPDDAREHEQTRSPNHNDD
jgi:hypothetical protein